MPDKELTSASGSSDAVGGGADSEVHGTPASPVLESVHERTAMVLSLVPLASGFLLLWMAPLFVESVAQTALVVLGASMILLAGVVPLLRYLQVGRISLYGAEIGFEDTKVERYAPAGDERGLRAEDVLDLVREEMRRRDVARDSGGTATISAAAPGPVRDHQPDNVADEISVVRDRTLRSTNRLNREIEVLNRRINLNLAIGVVTTIGSLTVLAALVFGADHETPSIDWGYVVPRVSLAVFVEAFAYFFLRLYRSGLEDIKYYENEITNLESWALGAELALAAGGDAIAPVTMSLVAVERNFRLAKGESTVGLERERIQQLTGSQLLEAVAKAAKP